jgi:hypothetical protein
MPSILADLLKETAGDRKDANGHGQAVDPPPFFSSFLLSRHARLLPCIVVSELCANCGETTSSAGMKLDSPERAHRENCKVNKAKRMQQLGKH